MANSYLFKTNYFGITIFEIHLLRSEYPYKKIRFEIINSIVVKQGSSMKYPIRALLLSLSLISIPTYLLLNYFGIYYFDDPHLTKMYSGFVFGSISMILFGLYTLFKLVQPNLVMKLKLNDGTKEVLELKQLKNNGEFDSFLEFLRSSVPTSSLFVQNGLERTEIKTKD